MPEIRLSRVVLPEPFGPKIPTISPAAIESETSVRAASPPKRLVRSMTSSSTAPTPQSADESLRQDQDRGDQHHAIKDRPGLGGELDHVRKAGQHECAGNGTDDRGAAAEQHHGDDVERLIDAEIIRLDIAGIEGVEAAGYRGEGVGQGEGQELVTERVNPERLRQILIQAYRRKAAADPGAQHERANSNRKNQRSQAEEIPTEHAIDLHQSGARDPDERLVENHQSEGTVGDVVPVEDDESRQLGKRQRDDGEIEGAQLKVEADAADDERDENGQTYRGKERQPEGHKKDREDEIALDESRNHQEGDPKQCLHRSAPNSPEGW